jgi:hypothetical protein
LEIRVLLGLFHPAEVWGFWYELVFGAAYWKGFLLNIISAGGLLLRNSDTICLVGSSRL